MCRSDMLDVALLHAIVLMLGVHDKNVPRGCVFCLADWSCCEWPAVHALVSMMEGQGGAEPPPQAQPPPQSEVAEAPKPQDDR